MNDKIKVAIADDHTLFRRGIIAILKSFNHLEVVGEAADGEAVVEVVAKKNPEVLLLDLVMPKSIGFDTIKLIHQRYPQTKIIVVSMYDTDSHIVQAVEAGASGYLSKNADPAEILLAIESAHTNGFYFTERTNKLMLQRLYQKKKLSPVFTGLDVKLNTNEIAIIKGISDELSSPEIAERLNLSTRTVDNIRHQLMLKLDVKNSIGLVLYAVRNGLVNL